MAQPDSWDRAIVALTGHAGFVLRSLQIRVAGEELVGGGAARGGEAHHHSVEQEQHRLLEEGAHGLDAPASLRAGLRGRLGRRGVHANDDLGELCQGRGGTMVTTANTPPSALAFRGTAHRLSVSPEPEPITSRSPAAKAGVVTLPTTYT